MPEQNYDLPAWINGSAPAISATNLLKYNNAIKGASTGLDARVAAVEGRVSAGGSGGIGSVDGVSVAEGGNIDLIAGSNMTITPNDAGDTITFASVASAGGVSRMMCGRGRVPWRRILHRSTTTSSRGPRERPYRA